MRGTSWLWDESPCKWDVRRLLSAFRLSAPDHLLKKYWSKQVVKEVICIEGYRRNSNKDIMPFWFTIPMERKLCESVSIICVHFLLTILVSVVYLYASKVVMSLQINEPPSWVWLCSHNSVCAHFPDIVVTCVPVHSFRCWSPMKRVWKLLRRLVQRYVWSCSFSTFLSTGKLYTSYIIIISTNHFPKTFLMCYMSKLMWVYFFQNYLHINE